MSLFVVNQQIKEHVARLHFLQEVICKGYHFTDAYSFNVVFFYVRDPTNLYEAHVTIII